MNLKISASEISKLQQAQYNLDHIPITKHQKFMLDVEIRNSHHWNIERLLFEIEKEIGRKVKWIGELRIGEASRLIKKWR